MEMTVFELIGKLELLAQNAKVVIEDDNGNEYQIDNVSEYNLIRGDTNEKFVTLTSNSIDTSRW
jgi:hypothetical protein